MKKFRNFFLMAAVALVGFSSCDNNEDVGPEVVEGESYLAISLGGVLGTRNAGDPGVIEAPGVDTPGTIQLVHAQVFVLNSANTVIHSQEISTAAGAITVLREDGTFDNANASLNLRVQLTNRIYVVGNTPAGQRAALAGLQNLDAIHAFTSAIATQANYVNVVLANLNGTPVVISSGEVVTGQPPVGVPNPVGAEMRHVNVSINPVISRLELHDVNSVPGYHSIVRTVTRRFYAANGDFLHQTVQDEPIQARFHSWDLTGVFVDNTFANFTYGGHGTGMRFTGMNDNVQLLDILAGNVAGVTMGYHITAGGPWTGNVANNFVARPANNDVWAFNVASGPVYLGGNPAPPGVTPARLVPRLIIRLENISWVPHEDYDWRIGPTGPITGNPVAHYNFGAPIPITGGATGADGIRFITVTGYTNVPVFQRGYIYRIGYTVSGSNGFSFTLDDIEDIVVINPEDLNVRVQVRIQEWRLFGTTPSW